DVKIKGQLAYAELTPAGLLYISRPDPATNAEVNISDPTSGQPKFQDAIESGRPWGGNDQDYDAARYYLHHVVEGRTLYVFANRDHKLYAVDRDAGTLRPLGGEIKLQGGEDPTAMEIRTAGIVLISPQNLVVVTRDGQVKQQVYNPAPQLPGLTRAPEGNGNVLLQIDKDSGQARSRVDLGKEREPVYAVDDVAGMLFLKTAAGTVVGYKL